MIHHILLLCIYRCGPDERGKAGGHEPLLFPLPGHILAFSLPAAMSHHYFPFRTTTFDSSGQHYNFKWYIKGI